MKRSIGSSVRDPENRSRKVCVCGGHNMRNWKSRKRHRTASRRAWRWLRKQKRGAR